MIAKADVALLSALRKSAREKMDAQVTTETSLPTQLTAISADLTQVTAKCVELTGKVLRFKLQSVAGNTVREALESVSEACELPVKRPSVTRLCHDSSVTTSTTAFCHSSKNISTSKALVRRSLCSLPTFSASLGWPLRRRSYVIMSPNEKQ